MKTEDYSKYWIDNDDGTVDPNYEAMVAELLSRKILMFGEGDVVYKHGSETITKKTLALLVFCSDVFAWGVSDAEEITKNEIPKLFTLCEENPQCGEIQWVCLKRNEKPQAPMIEYMKRNDGWTPEMEALPENLYDKLCREETASTGP